MVFCGWESIRPGNQSPADGDLGNRKRRSPLSIPFGNDPRIHRLHSNRCCHQSWNSGGPLYNAQGDLIGINGRCSFEKRGRVNVGVGYAISTNQAQLFLGHLKSGRIVDHATLGFTVSSENGRVVVSNILESSDAYRRGLRYGDEILRLDDREITSVNQLKNILGIFPSHSRLQLRYRQDNQSIDTWIRVSPLHTLDELEEIVHGEKVDRPQEKEEESSPPLNATKKIPWPIASKVAVVLPITSSIDLSWIELRRI